MARNIIQMARNIMDVVWVTDVLLKDEPTVCCTRLLLRLQQSYFASLSLSDKKPP